jgi:hypothetical protein
MLSLVARFGVRDQIDWWCGVPEDNVTFVVEIGGLFEAGLHDHVPVAPSDVDSFEQALVDVGEASEGDYTYGPALYACRLRTQRPREGAYPSDARLHRLFDAANKPRPGIALPPPPPLSVPAVASPVFAADLTRTGIDDGWPVLPESLGSRE